MFLLSRIEKQLEALAHEQKRQGQDLQAMKETLAQNTADVRHHIRRTELLETQVLGLPGRILTFVSIGGGLLAAAKLIAELIR